MENIYATPNSDVSSEEGEIHYSGFWIRVLASLIDTIWLLVLTFTPVSARGRPIFLSATCCHSS
jgi:hypothetical protein